MTRTEKMLLDESVPLTDRARLALPLATSPTWWSVADMLMAIALIAAGLLTVTGVDVVLYAAVGYAVVEMVWAACSMNTLNRTCAAQVLRTLPEPEPGAVVVMRNGAFILTMAAYLLLVALVVALPAPWHAAVISLVGLRNVRRTLLARDRKRTAELVLRKADRAGVLAGVQAEVDELVAATTAYERGA